MRPLVIAAVLTACSGTAEKPAAPPMLSSSQYDARPADAASGVDAITGSIDAPSPAPGMITDDECRARGGHVEDEHTYANERTRDPRYTPTPYRVCRIPAVTNGKSCTSSSQCEGRCMCTGKLAGPNPNRDPGLKKLDGTAGKGTCSDEHLSSGEWWCLVENGKIELAGIIID